MFFSSSVVEFEIKIGILVSSSVSLGFPPPSHDNKKTTIVQNVVFKSRCVQSCPYSGSIGGRTTHKTDHRWAFFWMLVLVESMMEGERTHLLRMRSRDRLGVCRTRI